MKDIKVFNQWNAPKGKKQDVHQEIYKWETIDPKTGEIVEHEENTQARIQSNLAKVDYKKMIERGELNIDGIIMEAGTRDFTQLSGDTVDTIDLLTKIANMDKTEIDNLLKQISQNTEIDTSETTKENNETVVTTEQTEPVNSGTVTENTEGGQN